MNDIEVTKFYIRHRDNYPEMEMQYAAMDGFRTLNVETIPYHWVDDIDDFEDLGPTVGVAGYIGDVWRALKKIGKPIPDPLDYPESLDEFLGRRVWRSTLGEVRTLVEPTFVKPVEHKLFTGFIWNADTFSRRHVVTFPDEVPVWCAERVVFEAEYRAFVCYRKVVGVRLYKGDWSKAPSRDVVETAVKAMGRKAPHAYALDWGVTDTGKTLLVEANDAFALGHYGLQAVTYARMLSARWHELTR